MDSIPRKIHYCWFGDNPLGEKELSCIKSWQKFLPDFEIIRWDESNFDVRCCEYVSEAYDAKKWAFVSDYARFKILYDNGGLYFDTDVEIVESLDDLIADGPFMGFETDCPGSGNNIEGRNGATVTVNPGLCLSSVADSDLYRLVLDSYEGSHFILPNGDFDKTTIVTRVTNILFEHGLENVPGIQNVSGVTIYPSEYFNPKDFATGIVAITGNTRSIHHFDASWYSPKERFEYHTAVYLRSHGVSDGVAKKIAAILRVVRFGDFSRISVALKNRFGV